MHLNSSSCFDVIDKYGTPIKTVAFIMTERCHTYLIRYGGWFKSKYNEESCFPPNYFICVFAWHICSGFIFYHFVFIYLCWLIAICMICGCCIHWNCTNHFVWFYLQMKHRIWVSLRDYLFIFQFYEWSDWQLLWYLI